MFKPMLKKFMLSLLLTAVVLSMFPVRAFADVNIHDSANLLKNPSFEEYTENERKVKLPSYWVNELEYWVSHDDAYWTTAVDGKYYLMPANRWKNKTWADQLKYWDAQLYQDVDVSGYNTGTVFMLSGTMSTDGLDKAAMYINFLDASGKVLVSKSISHRKKEWKRYSIIVGKPEKAVTARILLRSTCLKTVDNHGFFDAFDFRVVDRTYRKVVISKNKTVGNTVEMSATNGISNNVSSFTWWTNYRDVKDIIDSNGKISGGVPKSYFDIIVYAQDSEGNVGSFCLPDNKENEDIEPDVISEQNNTGTGGTQTPNTNTGGTQIQTPNTNTGNTGNQTPATNTAGTKKTKSKKGKKKKTVSNTKVNTNESSVIMKWEKYKGADYYLLEQYDFSNKKWKVVGFASKDQTSGEVFGLKKLAEYRFRVTAEKRTTTGSITLGIVKLIKSTFR